MNHDDPGASPALGLPSRKWRPLIGAVCGLLTGAVAHFLAAPIYESSASILIIPQRVPDRIIRSPQMLQAGERIGLYSRQVLSRATLERVLREFNLYERDRQRRPMEEVVAQMRRDISLNVDRPARGGDAATSFAVSFRSADADEAKRVTDRLASLFIQESLDDRTLLIDQTSAFLEEQAEELQQRLQYSQSALHSLGTQNATPWQQALLAQNKILGDTYRFIQRKQHELRTVAELDRRQIGEQFKVIDGSNLPNLPIGPARLPYLVWGVLGGATFGVVLVALPSIKARATPLLGVLFGVLLGAAGFRFATPIYVSSASMALLPQRLPMEIVRPVVTAPPVERIRFIRQKILTRAIMRDIVNDLGLYNWERDRMLMDEVIDQVLRNVSITVTPQKPEDQLAFFEIRFQSSDARVASRVTERLAALFARLSYEDRSRSASQTEEFLAGQELALQTRLEENQTAPAAEVQTLAVRHQVLQERLKTMLRKHETARMTVAMERRQIGERFMFISGGEVPENVMGPALVPRLLWGAASGLAASPVVMLLSSMWRRRRQPTPQS